MNFKCPKCGSTQFGSVMNDDGSLTRSCHGYVRTNIVRACTFSWHQKDDRKYGIERPPSGVYAAMTVAR